MPTTDFGKRTRVPWSPTSRHRSDAVTLPVYMAYCAVAASLRSWNRIDKKFIVTLRAQEDYDYHVYADAARYFTAQIWESMEFKTQVFEWNDKSVRTEVEAIRNERAIIFAPPNYKIREDERLLSDAVISLPLRTARHAEAALRRAGLPVVDKNVDLLISEPWPRLYRAFQERRDPLQALERLRSLLESSPVPTAPVKTRPTVPLLSDMHGYGGLVDWGNDLAKDLADYKAGNIPWADIDTGVLISGPPGVGKTMFASALANTCQVPIIFGSVSEWQEAGSLDDHLKAMRASFTEAKKKAPSILFVDEVDTFGNRVARDSNAGYLRGAMAGFLQLLDGFERREGIVVVAACNFPDHLDSAIRRPGRLDRHIEVTLPDAQSRQSILKYHCGITLDREQADQFSLATDGFSGAEIERLVRDARRVARRRSEILSADHLLEQLPRLTPLAREELRSLAVHEAGHALLGWEIGHGEIATIKISGFRMDGWRRELGYVEYGKTGLRSRTKGEYLNTIAVLLAGIAAEIEVFGSFADGSSGSSAADLNRATDIATAVEGAMGMGHTLIVETLDQSQLAMMRLHNGELREKVHWLLQSELERARFIIQRQRLALDALVERLMDTGELSGDEAIQILESNRSSTVSLAKPQLGAGK